MVCKFQIELKKGKIRGAQDRLPSQSRLRHVLCQNSRIHISACGTSPSYLQNTAASSWPAIIIGEAVHSCGKQFRTGGGCKGHLVPHHFCRGRRRRSTEHPATHAAHLSLTMQTECQYTRTALTNVTQAQTPGDEALPLCIDTFRSLTFQCVGKC